MARLLPFGLPRVALDRVRMSLLELQDHACFYRGARATPAGTEVDHSIPWTRHPDNGLDNLVAAHDRCNNAKRESLAAADHLDRWLRRGSLDEVSRELGWPSNRARTLGVARATSPWVPDGRRSGKASVSTREPMPSS